MSDLSNLIFSIDMHIFKNVILDHSIIYFNLFDAL